MQLTLSQNFGGWTAETAGQVREVCLLTSLIQAGFTCSCIHCLHEEITLCPFCSMTVIKYFYWVGNLFSLQLWICFIFINKYGFIFFYFYYLFTSNSNHFFLNIFINVSFLFYSHFSNVSFCNFFFSFCHFLSSQKQEENGNKLRKLPGVNAFNLTFPWSIS